MRRWVEGPGRERGEERSVRAVAARSPNAAAVLALQRGAGNRAVAAMLARVKIKSLGVDTAKHDRPKVLEALNKKWSAFWGLDPSITADEAGELLRFLGADLSAGLRTALEARRDGTEEDDPSSDDEPTPKQKEKEKEKEKEASESEDELIGLRFSPSTTAKQKSKKEKEKTKKKQEESESEDELLGFGFGFSPSSKTKAREPSKPEVAKRFAMIMQELGHPVFLSGGGAATLLGSGREIKDLDFRIELVFSWEDEPGKALIGRIDEAVGEEFGCFVAFQISDADTAYTIKTKVLSTEVSVTRTPKVSYFAHGATPEYPGKPEQEVPTLGEFDLTLDKAYSVIMRSEVPKQISDFFDLLFALNHIGGGFKAGCQILRFLTLQRGTAYAQQSARRKLDKDMLKQLHTTIAELLEDEADELAAFFKKSGNKSLLTLAPLLLKEIEAILLTPAKVHVFS